MVARTSPALFHSNFDKDNEKYGAYLLSLAWEPQVSRDVPADAGFLPDKAAVFGAAIKETPCTLCWVTR
jgi:hypothetical protein